MLILLILLVHGVVGVVNNGGGVVNIVGALWWCMVVAVIVGPTDFVGSLFTLSLSFTVILPFLLFILFKALF